MRRLGWLFLCCFVIALAGSVSSPADAAFSKATPHGKAFCPKGSFFDPRKGGQCWSCPKGWHRTVFPVTGKKACERRAYLKHKKATKGKKTKLAWQCKGKSFWDPWKGGHCWSCEGYKRTAHHINGKKACSRRIKAKRSTAEFVRGFGCGKGRFFDPADGGRCWSCPNGWHRTVKNVKSAKACSSSFAGVLAGERGAVCRKAIGAIRGGSNGIKKLASDLDKIIDPVMKPVNAAMKKLTPNMRSPRALNDMLGKVTKPLDSQRRRMESLTRYAKQVESKGQAIQNIILDPGLICGGNSQRIIQALNRAGLRPKPERRRTDILDGLFIGTAHAASSDDFVAFYTSFSGPVTSFADLAVTVTLITDFKRHLNSYFSIGPAKTVKLSSAKPELGGSVGFMWYGRASIDDFHSRLTDLGSLGIQWEIGLDTDWIRQATQYMPTWKARLIRSMPDKFVMSFDPTFWKPDANLGIGGSWGIFNMPGQVDDDDFAETTFSADYTFKLGGL